MKLIKKNIEAKFKNSLKTPLLRQKKARGEKKHNMKENTI